MRRKPGTDTKFPAHFAGNWLSVPGFAPRDMLAVRCAPKTVKHPELQCRNASAIGPSARAGRKHSAPTTKMVPRSRNPKAKESLGSVAAVVGLRPCAANRPDRANANAARPNRPASMATAVVALRSEEHTSELQSP